MSISLRAGRYGLQNTRLRGTISGMARFIATMLALFPMLFVAGQPARAQSDGRTIFLGEVSGWKVAYDRNLASCLAMATFTDDTTFTIGLDSAGDYFILLSNLAWRSIVDKNTYRLTFETDNGRRWRGEITWLEFRTSKGLIQSGLKLDFIEDLARSDDLTVSREQRRVTRLSLAGSRAAIGSIQSCMSARLEQARADAKAGTDRRDRSGKAAQGPSSGTGFFVSQRGHILTNAHVAKGCKSIEVSIQDRAPVRARLVAADEKNDLALLATEIAPARVPAFRSRVRVGENIYVFGFPLVSMLTRTGNFTVGHVSAVAGYGDDTSSLQISAPVQPGNSGGPLLDRFGNIVGVIVAKLNAMVVAQKTNDITQNVNFAIKSGIAASFLEANGVDPHGPESTEELQPADIAERAKSFTVLIACQ